jgi:hypothetical protein
VYLLGGGVIRVCAAAIAVDSSSASVTLARSDTKGEFFMVLGFCKIATNEILVARHLDLSLQNR